MKLFVGTYVLFCLIQLSVQQSRFGKNHYNTDGGWRSVGDDAEDLSYASLQKLEPQGGLDEPAKRIAAKDLPKSIGKLKSVKFVLKCGSGNVEKEEQVFITAGKRLPGKLQRVLESTDGYITVVYRDNKGRLTRIEKLRLPQHLPKETIPDGGLVIDRTELPWEPSINPLDEVETEEENNAKPLSIGNQNVDERPSSSVGRPAPVVSYDSPTRQVQPSNKVFSVRKPKLLAIRPKEYYIRTDDTGAPLRQISSA